MKKLLLLKGISRRTLNEEATHHHRGLHGHLVPLAPNGMGRSNTIVRHRGRKEGLRRRARRWDCNNNHNNTITMPNHAYIIDLSKDWQPSLKGVFFAENAPTFLCVSSPYHSADGMHKYTSYKPVPGVAERKAEALAKREVKRKIQEAIREEIRARKKEQDARDKELRAKLSAMRKAEDVARRKAEAEAKRKKRAEKMLNNIVSARAKKKKVCNKIIIHIDSSYTSQTQAARDLGLSLNTVSSYVKSNAIPCIRAGRKVYVKINDVKKEYERRKDAAHFRNIAFGLRRKDAAKRLRE